MNSDKKLYVGIDLFKMLCAILVVYMHTYCYDGGNIGNWFKNVVSAIGVPFFFIASGFFFRQGLSRSGNSKNYLTTYFKRVLIIYMLWTVISLPAAWYNICIAHSNYPNVFKLIYLIRTILLSGSVGIYWYILSLLYNSVIIYIVYKKHWEKRSFLIATTFFLIGVLYNGGIFENNVIGTVIHIVFGSERNFLNVGLFYMMIGCLIAQCSLPRSKYIWLIISVISVAIDTIIQAKLNIRIMQVFTATGLFMFGQSLRLIKMLKYSRAIRKLSTGIYLIHFPIILFFDYYLQRGTLIDFSFTIIISVLIYYCICKILPNKYVSALFGN